MCATCGCMGKMKKAVKKSSVVSKAAGKACTNGKCGTCKSCKGKKKK